ncbi:MAG: hypothetical protein ACKOWF_03960 [Chloroflexota bacterium]
MTDPAEEPQDEQPTAPPPFPAWRDHFRAAVIWPGGREPSPRPEERIALDPVHPRAGDSAGAAAASGPGTESPLAAAADQAARLAREAADMSREEREAAMQRLSAGMRPIASDAERIVVQALDFGASGLSRLADRIERRRWIASGLPPARRNRE